jgi:hypothetical protein
MAFLKRKQKAQFEGEGLVLFNEVQEAMKAEKVLKAARYNVKLVAPPPELRKGCDLAVAINLVEQPGVERILNESDVAYVSISPLNIATSALLEIVTTADFGRWVMVKAGNMKLTYEKESRVIVNTSGGGCPDIPVLHLELLGKTLEEAPRPHKTGYTLCALMLDRALEKAIEMREEDG